jgi:SAM-dependent methyltransferase
VAQANFLRLPVREAVFDIAVAVNVIEHMIDVRRGFTEIARALRPGGAFCGDSRNRFDLLLPEPHVKLRWVGLLPRRYAPRYVHWRRRLSYKGVRLLSYWELKQQLEDAFSQSRVEYPSPSAYGASRRAGRVLGVFQRRLPGISRLFLPWFPSFVALGIR